MHGKSYSVCLSVYFTNTESVLSWAKQLAFPQLRTWVSHDCAFGYRSEFLLGVSVDSSDHAACSTDNLSIISNFCLKS